MRALADTGSARMRIIASVSLLCGVACATAAPIVPNASTDAAARDSGFVTTLRARIDSSVAAGTFSGAVLVTRDGRTIFEGAYGLADLERNVPNTLLTQFRVGSMNKMMTA